MELELFLSDVLGARVEVAIKKPSLFLVAVGLQNFQEVFFQTRTRALRGASFVSAISVLVPCFTAQRHSVQGIVITRQKG